jgi:hypothetical protein
MFSGALFISSGPFELFRDGEDRRERKEMEEGGEGRRLWVVALLLLQAATNGPLPPLGGCLWRAPFPAPRRLTD